ncbi:MAG: hypothetical protein ABIY70_24805 [Capsulimonas sp.]|jgi:superfamily II DNA helicase RecQ|uniref:hypothetical protein n=1 Tax=Capsulimonas sp. TaxID=2494211 RepID=UPI003266EA20|nr:hypothetical protein [Capsulimonas sp.]
MTMHRSELKEMLRKATSGVQLTVGESNYIKTTYKELREEYEKVLEDSAEDEVKVLAISQALSSLEAKKISGPEFVSEVIYSVYVLKDKRKRDRMLRSEIAYRMALAAYFYDHVKAIKKIPANVPVTSEFLFQINELDSSLKDYQKYKAHSEVRELSSRKAVA